MPKISETMKHAQAHAIVRGIAKRFKPRQKLSVAGTVYTPAELGAVFQKHIDVLRQLRTLRAALAGKVQEERALAKKVSELRTDLALFLRNEFGRDPVAIGDFGLRLRRKPGPKTVHAKLRGAEQLRATRKARHTMGKRQRQKVKGTVAKAAV